LTNYYIYRMPDSRHWWDFPYIVYAVRPWPHGSIVTVCSTLRGARRAVAKQKRQAYTGDPQLVVGPF
jgi:hypothetical protein